MNHQNPNLKLFTFGLLFFGLFPLAWTTGSAVETSSPISSWIENTSKIRLNSDDLAINQGWPPDHAVPAIEGFFQKPLTMPATGSQWLEFLDNLRAPGELMDWSAEILFSSGPLASLEPASITPPQFPEEFPDDLKPAFRDLYIGIKTAQKSLNGALKSIPKENQIPFLKFAGVPTEPGRMQPEISSEKVSDQIEGMKSFDQRKLFEGAKHLLQTIDTTLPNLEGTLPRLRGMDFETITWKTDLGPFILGGPGNNTYKAEELGTAPLIIDLGGRNYYQGAAGGANAGEIRVVLDFGRNVDVLSLNETGANAAAGVFGIGLLYLLQPQGEKKLESAAIGLGCGVAGVGGLVVHGKALIEGDRYVQGAGTYGFGFLVTEQSDESIIVANRNAQGAGFVRGVGLFKHSGDKTSIKGGLVQPDPREPLGSVSICQGVGFGRRAFGGGGVGAAHISGDENSVEGSYFAQGCGYWHGLGLFRLKGNLSDIKARRYDQGSGVHFAFGHFEVEGNLNRIINWGVGPAYGWDRSVGSAVIRGDENTLQVDWGAATGNIGSLSLSYIEGDRNKLKLPEAGTGNFQRNETSYAIHIVEGLENMVQSPASRPPKGGPIYGMRNPWGVIKYSHPIFKKDLGLPEPTWSKLSLGPEQRMEAIDLNAELAKALVLPPKERYSALLDISAAFGLDKVTPRLALRYLFEAPSKHVPLFIDILNPNAVDALIKMQLVLAAHGPSVVTAILKKVDNTPEQKRFTLLGQLADQRPSTAVPQILKLLEFSKNPREDILLIRVLGALYNTDSGFEPGLREALKTLATYLEDPGNDQAKEAAKKIIERRRVSEALTLLNTALDTSPQDRAVVLEMAPEDLTGSFGPEAASKLLDFFNLKKAVALSGIIQNIQYLDQTEHNVRTEMHKILKSTQTAALQSAIIALGKIGHGEDASMVAPFLTHDASAVREVAAAALGRMGDSGLPYLEAALKNEDPKIRGLALAGVLSGTDSNFQKLIFSGAKDVDPWVRVQAVTLIANLPPALQPEQTKIIKKIKKLLRRENDPNVLYALSFIH